MTSAILEAPAPYAYCRSMEPPLVPPRKSPPRKQSGLTRPAHDRTEAIAGFRWMQGARAETGRSFTARMHFLLGAREALNNQLDELASSAKGSKDGVADGAVPHLDWPGGATAHAGMTRFRESVNWGHSEFQGWVDSAGEQPVPPLSAIRWMLRDADGTIGGEAGHA